MARFLSKRVLRFKSRLSRLWHSTGAWLHGITGDPVVTDITPYFDVIGRIKAYAFAALSDMQLSERSTVLQTASRAEAAHRSKHSHRAAFSIDIEAEAFALVREAARRTVGLDAFDAQMIAGLAMAHGGIAELPTGEGKTLAAVFPAYLHALAGHGAHVLTFNDYLARRDAAWMGPIYGLLGIGVGCVQEGMTSAQKRSAYARDVTYATAKEVGFDFLRDGITDRMEERIQRPFYYALVDEADSILIDEARIPLVISGLDERPVVDTHHLAAIAGMLVVGLDYATDNEGRNVFLLDAGIERAEAALGCSDLYSAEHHALLEALQCALHAEALLHRDVDYLVRDDRIEIVDEFTGRVVDKRHWPDGLQAAVEAKEGVARRAQGRILGSITLQHFFRLYPILAGTTATARSAAQELREFYGLATLIVPPHVPSRRADHPDAVFASRSAKQQALVREISETHATGRPILVGTASVRESEILAADLAAQGTTCAVLNAKNDEREAAIIAEAGRLGAVTISTNMAGRGTDIKLGGADESERETVASLGGLYVIGTNRHESLRIDRQLRGRAGRQGDPGSSRFFISLEDDLFERYGLTRVFRERHRLAAGEGRREASRLHAEIEHAQRVVEGQHFDIRRRLTRYSSLTELQRRIVQHLRDSVQNGAAFLDQLDPTLSAQTGVRFGERRGKDIARRVALYHIDRLWSEHLAWVQDTRDSIHLVSLGGLAPFEEFRKQATAAFLDLMSEIDTALVDEMRTILETNEAALGPALERLKAPASTWTYLVNDETFGWGIGLQQMGNIGQAVAAALYVGPILILSLILDRWRKRRQRRRDCGSAQ